MKSKLKNKFCRGGGAKTLGRCMFLKNQTTTLLKAYLWFATNTPAKNEQLALYS